MSLVFKKKPLSNRGIVRRNGSTSDKLKRELAKLTPMINIIFKDNNGTILDETKVPFGSTASDILALLADQDIEVFLPDYNKFLDEENFRQPLWSIGFYDHIPVVITAKGSTQPYKLNFGSRVSAEEMEVQSSFPEDQHITENLSAFTKSSNLSVSEPKGLQKFIHSMANNETPNKASQNDSSKKSTRNQQIIESSVEDVSLPSPSKPPQLVTAAQLPPPLETSTQLSQQPPSNQKAISSSFNQGSTSSSQKLDWKQKNSIPTRYHFIVKSPSIKLFDIQATDSFAVIFDAYEKASQGKKPRFTFGEKVINREDTPSSINAVVEQHNIIEVTMIDIDNRIKVSIVETTGAQKPVYFNVKVNTKLKKIFKKYSSECHIPLVNLEFKIGDVMINKSPNFTTIQDLSFEEGSGNKIQVIIKK